MRNQAQASKNGQSDSVFKSTLMRFVKGSCAGLMGASILQPLNVVKTSM